MTDEQLVCQAAQGDRAAMEELAVRIYPQVYRFYVKLCANLTDAQDLTQSAMIKLIENLHKFHARGDARLISWVFKLSYHLFIDYTRKKQPTAVEDAVLLAIPDGKNEFAAADMREQMQWMLGRLDAQLRALVVLRYYMDLGYSQIAHSMGMSEKRVKWRLHDALCKLRKMEEEVVRYG